MKKNAKGTGLVSDERYFWLELGSFLPLGRYDQPYPAMDSPDGKRRILNLIRASGIEKQLTPIEPRLASEEELLRFHTRDYLELVKKISATTGGSVGEATAICTGGYDIARLAAGGCMAAFDAVLTGDVENAFALVRPCGHHAEKNRARGFAVFGNLVVAIKDAKERHGLGRVAVIDWDVHHGNGTQWGFYDDPSVLTISIHQNGLYPMDSGFLDENGEGPGEGYNINVPLPAGSGHGAYMEAMATVVAPALQAFRPELIAVACGFDACAFDQLGRMLCHSDTYRDMTALIKGEAQALCDGRLVLCLEGGYAPVYMPYCGLATLENLAGLRTEVADGKLKRLQSMPGQELLPAQAEVIKMAAQMVTKIDSGNGLRDGS